jgi:hypothetical protein
MVLGAGGDALNRAIPTIPTYPLTWRLAKHKPAGDKGDLSPLLFFFRGTGDLVARLVATKLMPLLKYKLTFRSNLSTTQPSGLSNNSSAPIRKRAPASSSAAPS